MHLPGKRLDAQFYEQSSSMLNSKKLTSLVQQPFKKLKHLLANLDTLTGEISQVSIPMLLLLNRRGDDDHIIGTDPPPASFVSQKKSDT